MTITKEETSVKHVLMIMALAISLVNWPFEGYVIAKICRWFFVPLGAPVLAWYHGSAITMLVGLVTFRWEDRSKESPELPLQRATSNIFATTMALVFGWLLYSISRGSVA